MEKHDKTLGMDTSISRRDFIGGVGVARSPQVFLQRGQTVVTRIEGIGECRNICV